MVKVFLSYSHNDEKSCIELQKALNPLKRAGLISHWYDGQILPGTNWNEVIKENLTNSDLILFLISPDFLNSDYINTIEVNLALKRHF